MDDGGISIPPDATRRRFASAAAAVVLSFLTWDASTDQRVTSYQVDVRHVRPAWSECLDEDGVLVPCLDHYDRLLDVASASVPVPCPEVEPGRCRFVFPAPVDLEPGDILFFAVRSVAGDCVSE